MDKRPIGIFDSGVGGLTVVKALGKALPREDIIYLGDTARVPYGSKSKETVTRFAIECAKFLKKFNVKLIVVACNTASSYSLNALKKIFPIPVIGVVSPIAKEAASKTENFKIGIIGTKATVKSDSYLNEIKKINKKINVYQKACPLFVPLVEENMLNGKIAEDIAKGYLKELKSKNIDTLILGCTHYPLLKKVLKAVFNDKVKVIDSSLSIADNIKMFLEDKCMQADLKKKGKARFFVTDDPESFKKVSKIFLKKNISVKKVDIT